MEVISDWLQFSVDIHCIYYEELTDDPLAEMRKLLKYLHLPVNEERLQCIDKHSSGSFHRVHHQSEDPWSPELHQVFDDTIDEANKMLIQKTGRALPLSNYQYYKSKT